MAEKRGAEASCADMWLKRLKRLKRAEAAEKNSINRQERGDSAREKKHSDKAAATAAREMASDSEGETGGVRSAHSKSGAKRAREEEEEEEAPKDESGVRFAHSESGVRLAHSESGVRLAHSESEGESGVRFAHSEEEKDGERKKRRRKAPIKVNARKQYAQWSAGVLWGVVHSLSARRRERGGATWRGVVLALADAGRRRGAEAEWREMAEGWAKAEDAAKVRRMFHKVCGPAGSPTGGPAGGPGQSGPMGGPMGGTAPSDIAPSASGHSGPNGPNGEDGEDFYTEASLWEWLREDDMETCTQLQRMRLCPCSECTEAWVAVQRRRMAQRRTLDQAQIVAQEQTLDEQLQLGQERTEGVRHQACEVSLRMATGAPERMVGHLAKMLGNEMYGLLFAKMVGDRAFVDERKRLYLWDGERKLWRGHQDAVAQLGAMVPETLEDYVDGDHELMGQVHECSQQLGKREAVARAALCYLRDDRRAGLVDNMGRRVPLKGGMVMDLRKGGVRPAVRGRTPDDLFTYEIEARWDAEAGTGDIGRFMREIMCEEGEMVSFLQRVLGAVLLGGNRDKCFYFLWGPMDNGKSTLINLMKGLLGRKLFAELDGSLFYVERGQVQSVGGANPFMLEIQGKLMVALSEGKPGAVLNEAFMKRYVSDSLKTRRMRTDSTEEFTEQAKLFFVTNHLPQCSDDPAFWRRLVLIEFKASFVDEPGQRGPERYTRDPAMGDRLRGQGSQLLNWLLEGLRSYLEQGLNPPEQVRAAKSSYKSDMDYVARYIEECLDLADAQPSLPTKAAPSAKLRASDLYQNYRGWCAANRVRAKSSVEFGKSMKSKGHPSQIDNVGRYYPDVQLRCAPLEPLGFRR